jgi:hypothetical protein
MHNERVCESWDGMEGIPINQYRNEVARSAQRDIAGPQ